MELDQRLKGTMPYHSLFSYVSAALSIVFAIIALAPNLRSIARWSFALTMVALASEGMASGLSAQASSISTSLFWQKWKLVSMSSLPFLWLAFGLSYARGNAEDFLRKWSLLLVLFFVIPVVSSLVFRNELVLLSTSLSGSAVLDLQFGWAGKLNHLSILIGAIATLVCLERTYRASVGTARWKVKFMLLGLGAILIVRIYTSSQSMLYGTFDYRLDVLNSIGLGLGALLIFRSLFRKGNFEIEIYPSQAVLRNSLTILIAGLYLFSVGVLAKIVNYIGGDVAFPLKALGLLIALILLGLLLQSDQFRLRIRQFISRHFSRPMYDYRDTWKRFSEELSVQIEPREISNSLAKLISKTFEILSVSVWLFDQPDRLKLMASTVSSKAEANKLSFGSDSMTEMREDFVNSADHVNLDSKSSRWAKELAKENPKQFPEKGGARIAIPISSKDSLEGVIVLRDRVSGVPFSTQEYDILSSVSSHAAACLQNARLSQKVLESKELEAFQTMATFFVHDLKNAASTINLMVKNLPKHWENEEFRQDALRGISKTGQRIDNIIGKLSSIQNNLNLSLAECEINSVTKRHVAKCAIPDNVQLELKLYEPSPVAKLDDELIGNVIENLIMNAIQAIDGKGNIVVETSEREKGVTIMVTDNGNGMTEEFLNESLFKPFKTTKRTGLGIGMFQSKLIVEAHKGVIMVESALGKGTTFRLELPVNGGDN